MKTLKSVMFGLALLIACTAAKAINKPTPATLTKNDVLDIYVNAVIHGKIDGLDKMAEDVSYNMYRGDKLITLNKKHILESFKATENVEQACKYTTSIVEDNNSGMVVKLEMKYGNYVRTSFITIASDHPDWKITKIEIPAS